MNDELRVVPSLVEEFDRDAAISAPWKVVKTRKKRSLGSSRTLTRGFATGFSKWKTSRTRLNPPGCSQAPSVSGEFRLHSRLAETANEIYR